MNTQLLTSDRDIHRVIPGIGVTRRQFDLLRRILDLTEQKGFPPSFKELGAAAGISSSSTVHSHIHALAAAKLLLHEKEQARSLILTPKGRHALGRPEPAGENVCAHCNGTGRCA